MRSISRTFAVLAGLFLFPAGMAFAQQPSETHPQAFPKVALASSELRTMKSSSTGRDYDLYIHMPSNYAQDKAKKYPVLYILDGQWDFKLMDSVLGGLVYDKFVPEMITVGITYPGENADLPARNSDHASVQWCTDRPSPSRHNYRASVCLI